MEKRYKKIFFNFLIFCLIISLAKSNTTFAQQQNALSFDGVDDNVSVTGASALVASSPTKISMSCWVYAKNAAPAFPNFDGFVGFRNEVSADFYLLQISATTVEARFRNSAGTAYTIAYNGLQFNTWQHFVFTYDGTKTKLYDNGVLVDSLTATGNIAATNVNLTIGDVLFGGTHFYLEGLVDEVSMWNKALNSNEVRCIYKSPIKANTPGLQLYYNFNAGNASNNNVGLDSLVDKTGNINGALNGFALDNTASNWVTGVVNYTSLAHSMCQGQSYVFNGQTLTNPGYYSAVLNGSQTCDSVLVLYLITNAGISNATISNLGNTLKANQDSASYQWIKCNPTALIAGATSQTYAPTANGNYAVIITRNGCSVTTPCFNFVINGIDEYNANSAFSIYPNPIKDKATLSFSKTESQVLLHLFSTDGKLVNSNFFNTTNLIELDLTNLAKGIYILQVSVTNLNAYRKLVIE
jgi:hypothetical protein